MFIAALILAFSSGYFLAYKTPLKKAEKDIAATTNDALISKAEASQVTATKPKQDSTAKKAPAKKSQKRSTSVKKEKKISNKSKATKKTSSKNKKPSTNKSTATKKTPKPAKKPKPVATKKVPEKTLPAENKIPVTATENKKQPNKTSDANTESSMSEKDNTEKNQLFSIQVGVFDRQENAQTLVDEIKTKGFDAYISEYVSSKGFAKYNVRFGHFTERAEGRKRLDAFKQHFSLSAYIIINQ